MAETSLQDLLEFTDSQSKTLSFCKASPDHFDAWINHLPAMGSVEFATTLLNALVELSHVNMSTPKFFKCLELASTKIVDANMRLSQLYLVKSSSLNYDQAKAAETAHAINNLVIKCYNRAIIEGLKSKNDYVVAIGRSMEWLLQLALRCYMLYLPLPHNLWRQLNALYTFVECRNWLDCPFTPSLGRKNENVTLQGMYVQNALLACAQPLQLQQSQIAHLTEMLPALAELVQLTPSKRGATCLFHVNLSDANPPQYHKKDDLILSVQLRFFNLENVVEAIQSPEKAESFSSQLGADLAMHLTRIWHEAPSRLYERARCNDHVKFTLGINQAFLELTDGLAPTDFVKQYHEGLHQDLYDNSTNPVAEAPHQSTTDLVKSKGVMINHSEGGFCLQLGSIPTKLESGELITLMHPRLQKLVFAVIKWVQLSNRTNCKIGVSLLSSNAVPCVVQIISDKGDPSTLRAALLIDDLAASPDTPLLVCAKTGTRFCRAIRIFYQYRTMICKPQRQELVTGNIMVSRFSEISEEELPE